MRILFLTYKLYRNLDTTPWFDAWRDYFLRILYSGDHEFLKNYLACKLKK